MAVPPVQSAPRGNPWGATSYSVFPGPGVHRWASCLGEVPSVSFTQRTDRRRNRRVPGRERRCPNDPLKHATYVKP